MDVVNILRLSYLGATLGGLLVTVTPALRHRFLAYGPRASKIELSAGKEKVAAEDKTNANPPSNLISHLLDNIAGWTVPHDYFWTFYLLSTSLSIFWLGEILWWNGPTFTAIVDRTRNRGATMSFEQVEITWIMMFVQGVRRLYESLNLTKKSDSKMQAWHWVLGLLFYTAMSIAIWVEGIPVLRTYQPAFSDLSFRAPTLRTIISVLPFILASGLQHDCHAYLANLKSSKSKDGKQIQGDYKLPEHPAFQSLIAPHYTAECLIYLSLAVVAAPQGQWLNLTLTSALVFVVVNLGVTAAGTKKWYGKRFGTEAVKGKRNMIPFVW